MASTQVISAESRQVQAAPPSTFVNAPMNIIDKAIEKGTDPDTLSKLVDLHLKMEQVNSVKAFHAAMSAFQEECPPILTDSSGYRDEYRYASYARITAAIRPYLAKHGLLYTFDSETDGTMLKVTCTVHHVDGHSITATFKGPVDGTKMMNGLQKAASALTYGKRHSLLEALGIATADFDDDGAAGGRSPKEKPEQRPDAQQQAPRAERITKDDLGALVGEWKKRFAKEGESKEDMQKRFGQWAHDVTKGLVPLDAAHVVGSWTRACLDECVDDLAEGDG